MKRIYKLLLPLSSAAIVAPIVTTTSCTPTYNACLYEVSFANAKVATSLQECNKLKISFEDLICGTKNFHSGNYMIILGSECSEQSNYLFSNNPRYEKTHSVYSENGAFEDSSFYKAINKDSYLNASIDFGIVLYIDIETVEVAKKDLLRPSEDPSSVEYRSFDKKWNSDDVKEAKDRDINTDDKKVIVEGEYARNDKSATTMRDLLSYLTSVFTSTSSEAEKAFKCQGSSDMAYGLVWKEGVPQQFKQILSSEGSADEYFDSVMNLWTQKD